MAQSGKTMVVPPFWEFASGGGHGWANPDLLHDESKLPHIVSTRRRTMQRCWRVQIWTLQENKKTKTDSLVEQHVTIQRKTRNDLHRTEPTPLSAYID